VVSSTSNLVVSAPGKLMVSGEYAVLEGAEAVVTAVNRRAFARVRKVGTLEASAEARAAYAQVEKQLGKLGGEPAVDVSSLRSQGAKLGLGSSAAAAAAAAGLAFAQHGQAVDTLEARARVFQAAYRGHQDIAPQGSGADVAASVYGGFLRFRRHGETAEVAPIQWPRDLRVGVVWTGQEARTSTFLAKVSALAGAQPERHRALIDALKREAERFLAAVLTNDVSGVLASTAAYGRGMGELGEAAGVPIVNDTLRRVAELAEQAGGAAKPSGAGGGDVALALFPDEGSEQRFSARCAAHNYSLLLIELGAAGVRLEGASEPSEAR